MTTPVNKFRVLLDLETGDISLSSASDILDMKPSSVLRALAIYRENLKYLIEASNKLAVHFGTAKERKAVVEDIAAYLDITPRQVNRMMSGTGVPVLPTHEVLLKEARRENAKEKWKTRLDCALSVIEGLDNMESASEISEVSTRQMYRWVTKFLNMEGIGMRDLRKMTLHQRRKLSRKIEKEQGAQFKLEQESKK